MQIDIDKIVGMMYDISIMYLEEISMKKIIALLMAACMLVSVLCLTSCGEAESGAKVIEIQLTEEEYAFGVDKNQPELLEKAN